MSELCGIPSCYEVSIGLCNCCQRYMCQKHINEHHESLHIQLNPLVDQISFLDDELRSFDIHKTTIESREKLQQWRVECHEKIDQLFEKKCQELDQFILSKISRQAEQIDNIRLKLTQLMYGQETTRQDIDFLTANINRLRTQMNHIEQTYIQIHSRPLMNTDSILQITETIRPKINLSNLPSFCNTIDHPNNSSLVLTSNNKFLLVHQRPNLCLINQEMKIINHVLCPFDSITDMCWSSTLERFILIHEKDLILIDEHLMLIDKQPILQNEKWLSCTCSDTSLFLLTNEQGSSSIMEFDLLPHIELTTYWKSPVTCEQNEQIDSMFYNNERIALIIRNLQTKSVRIELKFSSTFDCIWSLAFDGQYTMKIPFHCCSLSFDEWLIADYKNSRLLHITKCGQIKSTIIYKTSPYNVHLFNQNILVVLTKHGKNLHPLI